MIYALSLYEVEADHIPAFKSLFAVNGLWHSFAGRLVGHVHTDLMNNSRRPGIFLALEFWESEFHYVIAWETAEVLAFQLSAQALSKASRRLGIFAFPSQHS